MSGQPAAHEPARRSPDDLPPGQRRALEAITESIRERGYAPTLRELCKSLGITSTQGAADHVKALVRKGYVRRDRMLSRGLALVDPPSATEGCTIRCPNDDGGDRHLRAALYMPGLSLDEHAARWAAIGEAFGVCPCGAKTVINGRLGP